MRRVWVVLIPILLVFFPKYASAQEPWAADLPPEIQTRMAAEYPDFFGSSGIDDRSFDYSAAMGVRVYAPAAVMDAAMEHLRISLATNRARFFTHDRDLLFRALLADSQCEAAHDILWLGFVENHPYLSIFASDLHFLRRLRWQVYGANLIDFSGVLPPEEPILDLRGLAACFAAEAARRNAAVVRAWAEDSTIPDRIQRAFTGFPTLVNANGSVHGARDGNYWHLIHMATQGAGDGYGPAGALFVELALELDSIAVPDDVLQMLLLRADETWPDVDADLPLPVDRARITELLPITAARLSADDQVHAEQCFLTDEPYNRLLLGEAAYAQLPAEQRCQP